MGEQAPAGCVQDWQAESSASQSPAPAGEIKRRRHRSDACGPADFRPINHLFSAGPSQSPAERRAQDTAGGCGRTMCFNRDKEGLPEGSSDQPRGLKGPPAPQGPAAAQARPRSSSLGETFCFSDSHTRGVTGKQAVTGKPLLVTCAASLQKDCLPKSRALTPEQFCVQIPSSGKLSGGRIMAWFGLRGTLKTIEF